jgi:hypothetical protein
MWREPRYEAACPCLFFLITGFDHLPFTRRPLHDAVFSQHRHDVTAFLPPFCPTRMFQIIQLREGEGWAMGVRFPWLTKAVIRVLEIAGAGLTSALVAYLLGRTDAPAPPPPPQVPAVVHLAPTDEEMLRSVRNDQAALLEQLRNETQKAQAEQPRSDSQKAQADQLRNEAQKALAALEAPAADNQTQTPNAAAKPAKLPQEAKPAQGPAQSNAPTVVRRDSKPERARPVESKPRVEAKAEPRAEELLPTRPANNNTFVPAAAPAPVAQAPVAPTQPADNEPGLFTATFKNLTAWLLPSRNRTPVPDASAARPPMPVFQPNAM